jgi:hypothetical protein
MSSAALLLLYPPPPFSHSPSARIASYSVADVGNLVNAETANIGLTVKNPRSLVLKLKNFETFLLAEMLRLCLTDIFNSPPKVSLL